MYLAGLELLRPRTPSDGSTRANAEFAIALRVAPGLDFLLLHIVGIWHDACQVVAKGVVGKGIDPIISLDIDEGLGLYDNLGEVVVEVFHRDFAALQSRHIHELRLVGDVGEDDFRCSFHVEKRAAEVSYAYHVAVFGEDCYQVNAVAVAVHDC